MLEKWYRRFRSLNPQIVRRMFWLGLGLLALGVFFNLSWELKEDAEILLLDQKIMNLVADLRTNRLNGAAVDVTALGSFTLVTLFTFTGMVLLLMARDPLGATHLLIAAAGSGVWTWVFKQIFARPRPTEIPPLVEVAGYSYPSGHSLSAAAIYLTLAFLGSRHFPLLRQGVVIFTLAVLTILLVASSRVYLGVHYPSDIASGILVGSAWALLLASYFSAHYYRRFSNQAGKETSK